MILVNIMLWKKLYSKPILSTKVITINAFLDLLVFFSIWMLALAVKIAEILKRIW
jgi:hypothetical protein